VGLLCDGFRGRLGSDLRDQVLDSRLPLDQLLFERVLVMARPYRGEFELVDLIEKVDQLSEELPAEKLTELFVGGKLLGRPGAVSSTEPVGEGFAQ